MPQTKPETRSLTPLDLALLHGPDAVIAHYEPTIAQMARKHGTQERATLNAPDLAQLGRLVVLRCFHALNRMPDVRAFDGLVKDAICKRLLTEKGKEFCVSRGRFLLDPLMEDFEEQDYGNGTHPSGTTAAHAPEAYRDYATRLTDHTTAEALLEDLRALLPKELHQVLDALVNRNPDKAPRVREMARSCGMTLNEWDRAVNAIQVTLAGYRHELFDPALRRAT